LNVQSFPHRSEGSHKGPNSDRALHSEGKEQHDKKQNGGHHYHPHHPDMQNAQLKPEYKYKKSSFGGSLAIEWEVCCLGSHNLIDLKIT
jgi:hypothetical protein